MWRPVSALLIGTVSELQASIHCTLAPLLSPKWGRRTKNPLSIFQRNATLMPMKRQNAERAVRAVAPGRKNFLFAGSNSGGERAAAMYTLIGSAKLNGIDPELYLRTMLGRSPITPSATSRIFCPGTSPRHFGPTLPVTRRHTHQVSTKKQVGTS